MEPPSPPPQPQSSGPLIAGALLAVGTMAYLGLRKPKPGSLPSWAIMMMILLALMYLNERHKLTQCRIKTALYAIEDTLEKKGITVSSK